MTLSSAIANYGLSALATPTGTNVANDVKVGVSPSSVGFSDADIVYSFKVLATANGDVATLTLSTGAVAQTTGTPTISDGDGNDFEGVSLPTMVTGYAILVQGGAVGGGGVTIASTGSANVDIVLGATETVPILAPLDIDGTIAFTIDAQDDFVTVTVIGKSS